MAILRTLQFTQMPSASPPIPKERIYRIIAAPLSNLLHNDHRTEDNLKAVLEGTALYDGAGRVVPVPTPDMPGPHQRVWLCSDGHTITSENPTAKCSTPMTPH